LGLCSALAACAAKKPPPPQRVTLGESNVEYRDYALVKGSLCGMDPRRLGPELQKINEVLEQFVTQADEVSKPEATPEQVETLRAGSKALGPVVQVHSKNLAGVSACGFKKQAPFPDILKKGDEVTKAAKAKLDEAPATLAAADQRIAEKEWVEKSATRETTAKQTWCKPGTVPGSGDLYFARLGLDGMTRWLFCDGIIVELPAGGAHAVIIPESMSKKDRKKVQEKRYVEAAKTYPSEEIDKLAKPAEAKE
jgi:hypothetical protein